MSMVYGQNIQLWLNDSTIAFAKDATFDISANEIDCSTKDSGGFENVEIGLISWSMQSNNLIGSPKSGISYDDLVALMLSREKVDVIYGVKDEVTAQTETYEVPATGGWPKPTKNSYYTGKAFITSINNSSVNGEVATYSVTLKGASELKQVKATGSGATTMSLKSSATKA